MTQTAEKKKRKEKRKEKKKEKKNGGGYATPQVPQRRLLAKPGSRQKGAQATLRAAESAPAKGERASAGARAAAKMSTRGGEDEHARRRR